MRSSCASSSSPGSIAATALSGWMHESRSGLEPSATCRLTVRPATGDGEAFRLSGLELDAMKKAGRGIIVTTPWEDLNTPLSIFCDVLDRMIDGYTKRQAEAVMLTLEGLTQTEIGDRIGTSQSAVSYRLKGTDYDIILKILEWYRLQVRERLD